MQNNGELCKLIKDTRNCIEGHKTADEAQAIIESIWNYTICKYPEYQMLDEMRQEDASEYLRRLMESEELLREESEIYVKVTSKCVNNECESLRSEQRKVMNIIYAHDIENQESILQTIIDQTIDEEEERPCYACHQNTQVTNEMK